MKTITINLIINNNNYGISNDAKLIVQQLNTVSQISGLFKFKVCAVPFYKSQCIHSDINIFIETINPLLIHYAKINIFIPNQEWFYNVWKPYLHLFDFIWCKTKYSENCFKTFVPNLKDKIHYIGWTSIDRYKTSINKQKDCLHLVGNSTFKGTETLLISWKQDWDTLHIVIDPKNKIYKKIVPLLKDKSNIILHDTYLNTEDLERLMNQCWLHLCPSEAEGFGHYINEALSCKSIVITTDFSPMNTFVEDSFLIPIDNTIDLTNTLGKLVKYNSKDFTTIIDNYNKLSNIELIKIGNNNRQHYLDSLKEFRKKLSVNIKKCLDLLDNQFLEKIPEEISYPVSLLPTVSIVTITKDRPQFFKLAMMNYTGIDYPNEKIEWIIVDDGKNQIKKTDLESIKDINYIYLSKPTSIGEKRNIAIKNAKNKVICMMDDDDIYPPRHLLIKLAYLRHYKKQCVYCSQIACFHIEKMISTINIPPFQLCPSKRVSEATLCFYKSFWKTKGFDDNDNFNEGYTFIKDRYDKIVELPWKDVIISLLHKNNISNRVKNIGNTPNGCHFGISDSLFKFITNLDNK